jgi:hypothetical protein
MKLALGVLLTCIIGFVLAVAVGIAIRELFLAWRGWWRRTHLR